jgi:hypothetical protein
MIGTVAIAFLVTGLIAGWLLRTAVLMSEVSRFQERMQKKVRYWQSEAIHARHQAERLASQLNALGYPPRDAYDEPEQDER